MHSTYVRPDVGRMPGTIRAIRAIESRQLAALKLQVIIQVILSRENITALVARVIFAWLFSIVIVDATMPIEVTRTIRYRIMNTCEQKRSTK
ncbi:hypothetical protein WN48_02077 [Eufriesea mexicana]|nr:hypothetical protein WN48_02077 [Eufriesea mexicana]